ncbi:mortality factor 4-like protein 1 [Trichogramma pretiosum]|uniref:mortality factor 4-like protein 1 n=1 Tax=Trichogramma pretiosum TaxID=7493 RepID=UPI0006C93E10|nr:mortality factor 4-like protein 1 [Trichogramma pretiosum]
MPPKYKFLEGEKVLCYHGPLIYEAKLLKSSVTKDGKSTQYYIHYAGWNKNWDEWVPEDRVLKFNDENVKKQKETSLKHEQSKESKQSSRKSSGSAKSSGRRSDFGKDKDKDKDSDSRASTPVALMERTPSRSSKAIANAPTPTSSNDSPLEAPRKRRGRAATEPSDDNESYTVKTEFNIKLPNELKMLLIDENEVIVKQKKLPTLPMSITVDKVFENYKEAIESGKIEGLHMESAVEVTKGIREYFNSAINLKLLYAWEKPQFEEKVPEDSNVLPSQLYGPYHLLRLLVKLGELMSYTHFDESSKELLTKHFRHFIQFLQSNISSLFNLNDYKDPPQDYQKKFNK